MIFFIQPSMWSNEDEDDEEDGVGAFWGRNQHK
jgi:hypothetical protein